MARPFRVDLGGMVDLLARHVYSSPRVFVRELLQNGVDAVTARRLADPDAPLGPVVLTPADAGGDGALVVADPGIGLTVDEVHELLATIGASAKRDVLDLPRDGFLGRFGIGLLSCFVVARDIEVVSRSATGGAPVRFTGHDDGTYDIEELDADDTAAPEVGTAVRLRPRPGAAGWLEADTVERLARLYGSALPVPIHVTRPDGGTALVTEVDPPWWRAASEGTDRGRRAALVAWCEQHLGFTPLGVVPLRAASADAEGVAFVLPQPMPPHAHPGHRAYVGRMLLGEDVPDLLPDWAFFVRAVLDVGTLSPTASREALVDDDAREQVQAELGTALRDWLGRLGTTAPDQLAAVLRVHALAAKALAAVDDDAYRTLIPWLAFESTRGTVTLPEVARETATLRFTTTTDRFRQLAPVARAQGLVLLNAGYTYDQPLIERIGLVSPGTEAAELDDLDVVVSLDEVAPDRAAAAAAFVAAADAALLDVGCDVELRAFEPVSVPALILHDDAARARRRLRSTAEDADPTWAALMADLDDGGSDAPLLICNDRHPLIRRLVQVAGRGEVVAASTRALYAQALMLGHRPLRGRDLELFNTALLDLVDGALRAEEADGG